MLYEFSTNDIFRTKYENKKNRKTRILKKVLLVSIAFEEYQTITLTFQKINYSKCIIKDNKTFTEKNLE